MFLLRALIYFVLSVLLVAVCGIAVESFVELKLSYSILQPHEWSKSDRAVTGLLSCGWFGFLLIISWATKD